jgi:hypothetical protein
VGRAFILALSIFVRSYIYVYIAVLRKFLRVCVMLCVVSGRSSAAGFWHSRETFRLLLVLASTVNPAFGPFKNHDHNSDISKTIACWKIGPHLRREDGSDCCRSLQLCWDTTPAAAAAGRSAKLLPGIVCTIADTVRRATISSMLPHPLLFMTPHPWDDSSSLHSSSCNKGTPAKRNQTTSMKSGKASKRGRRLSDKGRKHSIR